MAHSPPPAGIRAAAPAALPFVAADERTARLHLAACYRIFAAQGWDELIYNHISLRVPGEPGAFLINPFGLQFSEVTASNLVKIDIDGNKLDGSPHPVNPAGFVQHSVFHRHLADAHCVAHSHTTAGMAVASLDGGLRPVNFYACNFVGQLAYHDFEGITLRAEEGERLIAHLGDRRAMLLKNHGIVVMGETVAEVFLKHWALQRACEIQMATLAMGKPVTVADPVVAVHQRDFAQAAKSSGLGAGQIEFAAMVRRIDREDPSWRE